MRDVDIGSDALVLHGLLGKRRVEYQDIQAVVVHREGGLVAAARPLDPVVSAEVLVLHLNNGTEIEVARKLHATYSGESQELAKMASQIRNAIGPRNAKAELPDDISENVEHDLQSDDRPWWDQETVSEPSE